MNLQATRISKEKNALKETFFIPFQNRQTNVDIIPGLKDELDDPTQMSWQGIQLLQQKCPTA